MKRLTESACFFPSRRRARLAMVAINVDFFLLAFAVMSPLLLPFGPAVAAAPGGDGSGFA